MNYAHTHTHRVYIYIYNKGLRQNSLDKGLKELHIKQTHYTNFLFEMLRNNFNHLP